jgi:ribosome-binding protein aMBF1 (putative translation factor)
MLKNERQYKAAKKQIHNLKEILKHSKTGKEKMSPAIYNAMVAGMQSQIDDMQKEVEAYDALQDINNIHYETLLELPELLIKARIAHGWTQSQLAKALNVKTQQVQRYESTNYATTSLKKLFQIINALGLKFKGEVKIESKI